MRAAWVLLAVSACFRPTYDRPACSLQQECPAGLTCRGDFCEPPGVDDAGDRQTDAAPGTDAMIPDVAVPGAACWRLDSNSLGVRLSACPPAVAERLDIASDVSIDTTSGAATPSAIACALVSDGPDEICALSAKVIIIAAGAKLSARGARPLVLLAHDIDVQGTIDVASHVGQPRGAGSTFIGCNGARVATRFGGAGGGGLSLGGGPGGDTRCA